MLNEVKWLQHRRYVATDYKFCRMWTVMGTSAGAFRAISALTFFWFLSTIADLDFSLLFYKCKWLPENSLIPQFNPNTKIRLGREIHANLWKDSLWVPEARKLEVKVTLLSCVQIFKKSGIHFEILGVRRWHEASWVLRIRMLVVTVQISRQGDLPPGIFAALR